METNTVIDARKHYHECRGTAPGNAELQLGFHPADTFPTTFE